jgi:hypothetical protein
MSSKSPCFIVGYNDTAYGICNFTSDNPDDTPAKWANHCTSIARDCLKRCRYHMRPYYRGVIKCAERYQKTGKVSRIESKGNA